MNSSFSRRNFLKTSALLTLGASLAACVAPAGAPAAPAAGGEAAAPSDAPVHISFFNRGGEYVFETMDLQIAEFKKTHPNWEFELNEVAGFSHQEALLNMLAAGNGPDCWFDSVRTTGMLARKGVVEPLDDYLDANLDFNIDNFTPNTFSCQTFDGKVWGIPWDSGAMLIFFNRDLLDEAGVEQPSASTWLTWDELVEMGKQLTFDLDGNTPNDSAFDPGRVKQYGFLPSFSHGRSTINWSNGGEIIEADMTMPIDSDQFIESMNWLADLGLKHFISPSAKYQTAQEIALNSKNVAMVHDGVWSLGEMINAGIKVGMMQVPYKTKQTSYGQYSPMCVFKESEKKQEAFEFIYFCTADPAGQKIIIDRGQLQPTLKSLRDVYLDGTPPPAKDERQLAYDVFENKETYRWPGDKIQSYWNGWYQPMIDLWEPYLTDLTIGTKRWEDIASELRPKSEAVLATGEIPTA